MAVAASELGAAEISPEIGAEHEALVKGGSPPGASTLAQARKNVAARAVAGQAQSAQRAASSATGPAGRLSRPASPSTRSPSSSTRSPSRIRRAASAAANAPAAGVGALRSAGGGRGGRVPKLAVAVAVGAIALEVMSYITGQYFSFDWQRLGQQPLQAKGATAAYLPLYAGQQAQLTAIATGNAPATMGQQSQAAQAIHSAAFL